MFKLKGNLKLSKINIKELSVARSELFDSTSLFDAQNQQFEDKTCQTSTKAFNDQSVAVQQSSCEDYLESVSLSLNTSDFPTYNLTSTKDFAEDITTKIDDSMADLNIITQKVDAELLATKKADFAAQVEILPVFNESKNILESQNK